MGHIDASTKDLSVALIALVCSLLFIGTLFLFVFRYYARKGEGYQVTAVDKGFTRQVARPGNGESSNTFLNEAYSMEKVNY
jgi:hypothetical protein